MRIQSSIAVLLILNAYCAVVLGLILLAVDPEVDWTIGFFSLMGFVCFTTGPCFKLIKKLSSPSPTVKKGPSARHVEFATSPSRPTPTGDDPRLG